MTISVLHERAQDTTASVSSFSLAFVNNITANSAIHAAAALGKTGAHTQTIADNVNGSYSVLNAGITAASGLLIVGHSYFYPAAAGATTVTTTFSAATTDGALCIREIGGCAGGLDPSASPAAHAERLQTAPGTGANAIQASATGMTPSQQPGLISTICYTSNVDDGGGLLVGNDVAYTQGMDGVSNQWPTIATICTGSFRFTSLTALKGSFTDAPDGAGGDFIPMAAIFLENAAAAGFVPYKPVSQPPRQDWNPNQYQARSPNMLASGTAPQLPHDPVAKDPFVMQRRPDWTLRDYWTRPPNSLPVGVTLATPGASQLLDPAYRRDPWTGQQPVTYAPISVPARVPPTPIPAISTPSWRPDQFQVSPTLALASGATLAQPGPPPPPVTAGYRREAYWSLRDYWTAPPLMLPQGAGLAVPGPTTFLDPAYRRDPWTGQQPVVFTPIPQSTFVPPAMTLIPWSLFERKFDAAYVIEDEFNGISGAPYPNPPFQPLLDPAYRRETRNDQPPPVYAPIVPPVFVPSTPTAQPRADAWRADQFQIQKPAVLPQGAAVVPGPSVLLDPAYFRPAWTGQQPQVFAPIVPPVFVPYSTAPSFQPVQWRLDQYQTTPPTVLPAGVAPTLPRPTWALEAAHRRDQYWALSSYWTQPPAVPTAQPITTLRVRAVVAGVYRGHFRYEGDVFDILSNELSDSSVNYAVGSASGPVYGWMTVVSPGTSLQEAVRFVYSTVPSRLPKIV